MVRPINGPEGDNARLEAQKKFAVGLKAEQESATQRPVVGLKTREDIDNWFQVLSDNLPIRNDPPLDIATMFAKHVLHGYCLAILKEHGAVTAAKFEEGLEAVAGGHAFDSGARTAFALQLSEQSRPIPPTGQDKAR